MPGTLPWLVVIDMQAAFADPSSVWAAPRYEEITPVIGRLVKQFTGRVVYTRFVRDPNEEGAWRPYYDRWPTMRQPADSPLWDLTLSTAENAPVVSEPTFSKWGPQLERVVGADAPLVLCGVATDCCVLGTAYAAADASPSKPPQPGSA